MLFETVQRVLGKEAEPDWVQFQSFVYKLLVNGWIGLMIEISQHHR